MAMVALVPLAPIAGKLALTAGKGALVRSATRSFASGAAFQAGAELVAQIAEWARSIDGNWDSEGQSPNDGIEPTEGCWKVEGGAGIYEEREDPNLPFAPPIGATCNVVTCIATYVEFNPENGLNTVRLTRTYTDQAEDTVQISRDPAWQWRINPSCGTGTCSSDPYPGAGGPNGPIDLGPLQSGNCNINVTFMGFMGNEDGTGKIEPVYYLEPSAETLANGGVIVGECNFQPTVMIGGGGDGGEPPRTYPNPDHPFGSDEWWKALAKGVLAGVGQAITNKVLEALLNKQEPASFTLVAPCDKDDKGNNLFYEVEFPEQSAQDRLLDWQIAQAYLLQQHLNWKTPICGNEKPPLEGQWVTTRWESLEKMAHSGRRLRKLFRYRTKSARTLGQLSSYWEAFTWQSGDVCVYHKGAWWGTPQVWASTEEEGKRVIRFAAAEAGIDPDQVGEWGISSSRAPRYGMSGTMKIQQLDGFPWVSSRNGPDWPNVLAKAPFP